MICYEFNDGRYICNSSCALRFPDHHGFIHMDAVQFTPSTCTGHLAMWPGPRPRDPTSKPDLPARPPRSSRRPETARRPDSVSFLSPPSRCGRKERGNDRTSSPRYSFCTHGAIRKSICIWSLSKANRTRGGWGQLCDADLESGMLYLGADLGGQTIRTITLSMSDHTRSERFATPTATLSTRGDSSRNQSLTRDWFMSQLY